MKSVTLILWERLIIDTWKMFSISGYLFKFSINFPSCKVLIFEIRNSSLKKVTSIKVNMKDGTVQRMKRLSPTIKQQWSGCQMGKSSVFLWNPTDRLNGLVKRTICSSSHSSKMISMIGCRMVNFFPYRIVRFLLLCFDKNRSCCSTW